MVKKKKRRKIVNKLGRPSKKDADRVQLLCEALQDCMPLDRACDLVGIHRNTVYEWIKTDPIFRAKIQLARANAVNWLVNRVKLTDPSGPWKILKSTDPRNFGDEIRIREIDDEKDEEADGMSVADLEKIAR